MLTLANLPVHLDISKISALRNEPLASSMPRLESQPQVIEPEAPPLIKSLVSPPVTPLRVACPDAPRTFRDSPLDMAFPAPAYQPHCHALKFVSALPAPPPCDVSPQSGQIEYLPAPQPVRFRMLLDLRGAAFQTSTHLLFPARLVPLTWNAAPPEALDWPLALQRRRPGPILPKLEPVLHPQERYL
jgi:hypothetical protein